MMTNKEAQAILITLAQKYSQQYVEGAKDMLDIVTALDVAILKFEPKLCDGCLHTHCLGDEWPCSECSRRFRDMYEREERREE